MRSPDLCLLEAWLRSYRPGELFDEDGRPRQKVLAHIPNGAQRLGATPHANGGAVPDIRGERGP